MSLYNLKLNFYFIIEYFENKYCIDCDNILIDGGCDYCDDNF